MKIGLIGNLGYIGSALTPYLQAKGYEVYGADIGWYNNNMADQPPLDMLPHNAIYGHFHWLTKMDAVILLAGHSSVAMCHDMYRTLQANVFAPSRIMEELKGTGIKFIYISSASVYGAQASPYYSYEQDRLPDPMNYYDMSKQMLDQIAQKTNLDYYGLRLATVNGWSPNIRIDLMANAMAYSAVNEGVVNVSNGAVPRSILDIKDLCRAIQAILEGPKAPGIYNLASFHIKVKDIADFVAKYFDVEVKDKGFSPTYMFQLDTLKFQNTFGFKFFGSAVDILEELYHHRHRLKLINDLGLQDNYKRLAR